MPKNITIVAQKPLVYQGRSFVRGDQFACDTVYAASFIYKKQARFITPEDHLSRANRQMTAAPQAASTVPESSRSRRRSAMAPSEPKAPPSLSRRERLELARAANNAPPAPPLSDPTT